MINARFNLPKEIKQVLALGLVIFVAVLFLGGKAIYKQSISQLIELKKERNQVSLENKVGKKLGELQEIREKQRVVKESSQFLSEIAKLSAMLNMKMISISAVSIEKRNEYVKIPINLELETTYHQLGSFISKLENEDLFINIEKLIISLPEQAAKDKTRILASLVISTFYLEDTSLEK